MTTVKRFKVTSQKQADHYVRKLRRQGRSAWCEAEGSQHYLCFRLEIVRIRADNCIRPFMFN